MKNLIFLAAKDWAPSIINSYKEDIDYLIQKYWINPYILYLENWKNLSEKKIKLKNELEKNWYIFKAFETKNNLFEFAQKLKWEKQVFTYKEQLIPLSIKLKKSLWQQATENDNLFVSKKLQRQLLLEYNKDIAVNYKKFSTVNEIDPDTIIKEFEFPFIIKPSTWIASWWVYKIGFKKNFLKALKKIDEVIKKVSQDMNIEKNEIIIEEFIDGKMYTIDYFVDEKQNIYITKPVRTFTLKDEYWIDDFGITKEILWDKIEKEIEENKLLKFIENNVKACKIRNHFVHHEFKLTSNWQLKTIELNWRIWWFRREMYRLAYNLTILEYLFNKNINPQFKQYYMFVGLFPTKEMNKIYSWIKDEFLKQIKSLSSFYQIKLRQAYIWNKIWFTKNGYKFFWTLRLVNKSYKQIEKDYQYIKENLQQNIIYK